MLDMMFEKLPGVMLHPDGMTQRSPLKIARLMTEFIKTSLHRALCDCYANLTAVRVPVGSWVTNATSPAAQDWKF